MDTRDIDERLKDQPYYCQEQQAHSFKENVCNIKDTNNHNENKQNQIQKNNKKYNYCRLTSPSVESSLKPNSYVELKPNTLTLEKELNENGLCSHTSCLPVKQSEINRRSKEFHSNIMKRREQSNVLNNKKLKVCESTNGNLFPSNQDLTTGNYVSETEILDTDSAQLFSSEHSLRRKQKRSIVLSNQKTINPLSYFQTRKSSIILQTETSICPKLLIKKKRFILIISYVMQLFSWFIKYLQLQQFFIQLYTFLFKFLYRFLPANLFVEFQSAYIKIYDSKIHFIAFCRHYMYNLCCIYKLVPLPIFRIIRCPFKRSVDSAIRRRIFMLTIYFCLHYIMLALNVWNHPIFEIPPKPPNLEALLINYQDTNKTVIDLKPDHEIKLQQFLSLVHPHIDSHPHLHAPLETVMRNCLGFIVIEWVVLLWLSTMSSIIRKKRLFGFISFVVLFVNITGTVYGGLENKAVLFPDLWGYLHHRLKANLFGINMSEQVSPFSFFSLSLLNIKDFFNQKPGINKEILLSSEITNDTPLFWNFILPIIHILYTLDVLGVILCCISTYEFLYRYDIFYSILSLLTVLNIGSIFLSRIPIPDANDHHWVQFKNHIGINFQLPNHYTPPIYISTYITMPDGVEIAADIYIPESIIKTLIYSIPSNKYQTYYTHCLCSNLTKELFDQSFNQDTVEIPTMMMITRYNRRMTVRWPFTLISLWGQKRGMSTTNVWSWQFVETLVANQYVVVVIDTRGTGASFGTRPVDFSPQELSDLKFIKQWLTKQFWFNGKIATGGFSYDGMTGLHLAGSESVQAVLALFTPINVVHDLIQPGGLVCSSFVEDYTGLTRAFELGGTPRYHVLKDFGYDWYLTAGFVFAFGVASPVKSRESSLPKAIAAHQENWNMSSMVEAIHFTDDFVVVSSQTGNSTTRLSVNQFGINRQIVETIALSRTPVYIVGGYCDSSSVRGSVRLFEALEDLRVSNDKQNQLILGPWTHTGRRNCSPYSGGTHSHFEIDMYWDILRFLDLHLKNKNWSDHLLTNNNVSTSMNKTELNAKTRDFPVHFWSIGEEHWIGSTSFPPLTVDELDFVFDTTKPMIYVDTQQLSLKKKMRLVIALEKSIVLLHQVIQEIYNYLISMFLTKVKNYPIQIIQRIFSQSLVHGLLLVWDFWKNKWLSGTLARQPIQLHPYSQHDLHNFYSLQLSENKRPLFENMTTYDLSYNSYDNHISYKVDYNASTRGLSRWVIAKHPFRMSSYSYREFFPKRIPPSFYSTLPFSLGTFFNLPFWSAASGAPTGDLLTFTSLPLNQGLRIAGSPLLRFSINLTDEFRQQAGELRRSFIEDRTSIKVNELVPIPALDLTVFGYIEDVNHLTKQVHYVTEGRILLSHRPTVPHIHSNQYVINNITGLSDWNHCTFKPFSDMKDKATVRQKPRIGSPDVVYQNGDRSSHRFSIGGTECVSFTFEPIAWYFKPGHSIRLSLAGTDRANFHWSRTQSKENANLFAHSLLSAVQAGDADLLKDIHEHSVRIARPEVWHIPIHDAHHSAFLKLPILS